MVVDQGLFGFVDGLFDGVQLLGEVEARPAGLDHGDHAFKVAGGALQPLHDVAVRLMGMIVRHSNILSPGEGIGCKDDAEPIVELFQDLIRQGAGHAWLFVPSAIRSARCTGWSPAIPRR